MTDRRPDTRPPRVRAAEFAASRWTIASGARLHVHLDDDHARVEIAVLRDALGGPPNFPSLVDHHLVWLILDLAADPDELILTQTLRGFTSITTTYYHPRSDALARYADRIAAATRAFATEPPLPDLRDIDAGRGAWQEAARRSSATTACTLALPPAPTPDELAAQLRALRTHLHDDGIPKAEANRRIRTHQCIRRLVAAIADLYGADALLAGDLLAPAIVIYRDGHPVLRHVTTLLGERTYAAPDLPIHDRLAIERRLTDLRTSLITAVTEHTCIRTPDDDAHAIDRALQRLHAHTPPAPTTTSTPRSRRRTEAPTRAPDSPPHRSPEPTAARAPEPAPEPAPALTTLTLTPEQRLWLLDLLAGFVEDHDANLDETDPTPPPPNVEWARTLADQLSAEIAALAEHPPP